MYLFPILQLVAHVVKWPKIMISCSQIAISDSRPLAQVEIFEINQNGTKFDFNFRMKLLEIRSQSILSSLNFDSSGKYLAAVYYYDRTLYLYDIQERDET